MVVNEKLEQLINFNVINSEEKVPLHCKCCGFKSGKKLRGRYKYGPYEYVCDKCHDYDFSGLLIGTLTSKDGHGL